MVLIADDLTPICFLGAIEDPKAQIDFPAGNQSCREINLRQRAADSASTHPAASSSAAHLTLKAAAARQRSCVRAKVGALIHLRVLRRVQ